MIYLSYDAEGRKVLLKVRSATPGRRLETRRLARGVYATYEADTLLDVQLVDVPAEAVAPPRPATWTPPRATRRKRKRA